MTRCSCKTKGITMFLELCPFLTKIFRKIIACDSQDSLFCIYAPPPHCLPLSVQYFLILWQRWKSGGICVLGHISSVYYMIYITYLILINVFMTFVLQVDASCDYRDIPYLEKFEPTFKLAGGINLPKIISCVGSDGTKSRQLVKVCTGILMTS